MNSMNSNEFNHRSFISHPQCLNQVKSQESPPSQLENIPIKRQVPQKSNFKWTFEEHAKYIYFLQMNKVKIKSKLIRKSNAFFKEMEHFLQTKTALQCRSHHQKFQQRYKFPHRIITGQKKYIPADVYTAVRRAINFTDTFNNNDNNNNENNKNNSLGERNNSSGVQGRKQYATVSSQTQICDIRKNLIVEQQKMENISYSYPFPMLRPMLYYHQYPYTY